MDIPAFHWKNPAAELKKSMAEVQILDPAQYEFEEIANLYMTLAGPESARKITDKIFEALERLKLFPLSGPLIHDPELSIREYRFLVVEKYILIYRLIGNVVFVYHIFDGRSDHPALFRSEMFFET